MSRLTLARFSVLSSLTLFAVAQVTACSGDDAKSGTDSNSNGNATNAGPNTTGTMGPTTGTTGSTTTGPSTTGAGPTTAGPANSTGSGTQGTQGSTGGTGGTATTGSQVTSSGGGASTSTEGGISTTGGGNGGGGTGGGGNNPIAGTDSYDCSPAEGTVPALKLTEVASGINVPVDVTHPPNDPRLFVITLTGDVRIIKDGQLVAAPFLSLGSKVAVGGQPGDERGLLGIAFHPNYATNGLFYLHYSAGTGVPGANTSDTVIEEYKVSDDPDVADAASARVVLTVAQPDNGNAAFQNHKGGSINFGADGLLYIGLGDGGGSGDVHGSSGSGFAQDTSRLLGKILRIDPTGGDPYSTPADNLVQDIAGAAPEIWDYGFRNPFRRTFDACTGDMYIGDVGQDDYEEIDIEKAGEGRKNYGWNVTEGLHCYTGQSCDDSGFVSPLLEEAQPSSESITGGSVYRGSSIPALRGAYFYGDYAKNGVWYTFYDRDAHTVSTKVSVTQELNVTNLVAIKNGSDGELYFVRLMTQGVISGSNRGEGAIYKLEAAE